MRPFINTTAINDLMYPLNLLPQEFQLLHPVLSRQEKRRSRKTRERAELQLQQQEVYQEEVPFSSTNMSQETRSQTAWPE